MAGEYVCDFFIWIFGFFVAHVDVAAFGTNHEFRWLKGSEVGLIKSKPWSIQNQGQFLQQYFHSFPGREP